MSLEAREREQLLEDLGSPDEEVRRLAVERLASLPDDDAIPRLVACLGDPGWRVRKAAVARLVEHHSSGEVLEALVLSLADGENPGRRNAAVEALVACGARAIAPLERSLDSRDVDVRKFAVDALAGIASDEARPALVACLGDADPNVRAAAADALGGVGGAAEGEALLALALCPHEDGLVRFSGLRALARLEVPVTAEQLAPALEDPTLRAAAFELLGRVDDALAEEQLLKGLTGSARAARESAMQALLRLLSLVDGRRADEIAGRIRDTVRAADGWLERVCPRLAEADLSTRLALVQFLGLLDSEDCVLPILEAGRDEAIREVAHATLDQLGETTERALEAGWPQLDVELRRDASRLLGQQAGERGQQLLLAALDDSDLELRAAAARALGECGTPLAIAPLARRLELAAQGDDPDAEEEVEALVAALAELADGGRAGQPRAREVVAELAIRADGAPEAVRLAIARILARIGRPEDEDLVILLLKDPSPAVRRAAVDALSRLEDASSCEALRLALADEACGVRIAAARALGESSSPAALEDLKRLQGDEDDRVRAAAVRAIGCFATRPMSEATVEEALELIRHATADCGVVAMAAGEALQLIGSPAAARIARALLGRREPELVQAGVSCVAAQGDPETLDDLIALISHASWAVRAEVIQALAERRVVKAVPPILRRLEAEQDSFVRDAILRALRRLEAQV